MFTDINRVTLVGRLTRDPEVRYTSGGMAIVSIGLAVNGRRKNAASGEWEDKPNFFDVKLFGDRGERAAERLQKGTRIGVDGRLEWDSWETDGQKRSKVEVIANDIQILDGRRDGDFGGGQPRQAVQGGAVAPDTSDFVPVGGAAADDDDIPF